MGYVAMSVELPPPHRTGRVVGASCDPVIATCAKTSLSSAPRGLLEDKETPAWARIAAATCFHGPPLGMSRRNSLHKDKCPKCRKDQSLRPLAQITLSTGPGRLRGNIVVQAEKVVSIGGLSVDRGLFPLERYFSVLPFWCRCLSIMPQGRWGPGRCAPLRSSRRVFRACFFAGIACLLIGWLRNREWKGETERNPVD